MNIHFVLIIVFAAEKGERQLWLKVHSGLHQLYCSHSLYRLHTASVSSGVLQRYHDLLFKAERNTERPFFCHKRPLCSHRMGGFFTLLACNYSPGVKDRACVYSAAALVVIQPSHSFIPHQKKKKFILKFICDCMDMKI